MKKILTLVLAFALVLTLAVGCAVPAPDAPADKPADEPADDPADEPVDDPAEFDASKYPVAICMDNYNHPVHRSVQLGFLKKAEELGYTDAKVIGTEGSDPSEVFSAATAFSAEGGKGLLLWYGDASCLETVATCGANGTIVGIPHFSHKLDEQGTLPEGMAFNFAPDPTDYGKKVAQLMAEKLDGKSGSVAITQNTKNVTENAASETFIAEWEVQAANYDLSKIKLLDVQLEGGVVDEATAVNLAIIQSNPDIIGAFGTTGNSPITWADAATKAGKADGEIFIVGMDPTEGNLNYLKQGKVGCIVANPLTYEGALTMEYIDKILRGETVPTWTDLEAPLVTADGEGENGPDYWIEISNEVTSYFGN